MPKNYIVEYEGVYGWSRSIDYKALYTEEAAVKLVKEGGRHSQTGLKYRAVRVLPRETEPTTILENVRVYLTSATFHTRGKGLGFYEWLADTGDAVDILDNATDQLTQPEPEPVVLIAIDLGELERRVLAGAIADGDIPKLLPFQTALGKGENHIHLINESAYVVTTNSHVVGEGDTLCARAGGARVFPYVNKSLYPVTCPGCLIKAKNLIVDKALGSL